MIKIIDLEQKYNSLLDRAMRFYGKPITEKLLHDLKNEKEYLKFLLKEKGLYDNYGYSLEGLDSEQKKFILDVDSALTLIDNMILECDRVMNR